VVERDKLGQKTGVAAKEPLGQEAAADGKASRTRVKKHPARSATCRRKMGQELGWVQVGYERNSGKKGKKAEGWDDNWLELPARSPTAESKSVSRAGSNGEADTKRTSKKGLKAQTGKGGDEDEP